MRECDPIGEKCCVNERDLLDDRWKLLWLQMINSVIIEVTYNVIIEINIAALRPTESRLGDYNPR